MSSLPAARPAFTRWPAWLKRPFPLAPSLAPGVSLVGVAGALTLGTLVVVSALLHAAPSRETLDLPLQIIAGTRVAGGDLPFRDVFVYYGPLGHYVFGWALALIPFEAAQAAQLFSFLLSLVVFGLVWRLYTATAHAPRWPLPLLVVAIGASAARYSFIQSIALAQVLAACLLARVALTAAAAPRARVVAAAALGVLSVATVLTRLHFGGYLVAATGVSLLYALVTGDGTARRAALAYGAGAGAAAVLATVVLTGSGVGPAYVTGMAQQLSRTGGRQLPLSGASPVILPMAIGVGVLVAVLTAVALARRGNALTVFLAVLASGFLTYALYRLDEPHLYPLLILGSAIALETLATMPPPRVAPALTWGALALAALALFAGLSGDAGRLASLVPAIGALAIVAYRASAAIGRGARAASVAAHATVALVAVLGLNAQAPTLQLLSASVREGVGQPSATATGPALQRGGFLFNRLEAQVLDYLGPRIGGDGILFATVPGTCESASDRCANHALYLALGKLPEGKYWIVDTPVSPYPSVQDEMVATLRDRRTRFVVLQDDLWPGEASDERQRLAPVQPEAPILYDYVRENYRVVYAAGGAEGRLLVYERAGNL